MSSARTPLPIDEFLPEIMRQLGAQSNLVLTAEPGAGKTTRLPPALLSQIRGKILVLEPRRIAALSSAARIAEENGWELGGNEVGYQVRFDNKTRASTRLVFLTEALLVRKMLQDPELNEVGCVVLDEFHERSLHTDLALALVKELQELSRPDLKIVVMSATLDAEPLARYLGTKSIARIPGRTFPLTTHYDGKSQSLRTGPEFIERLTLLTLKAFGEEPEGDVLVFLPGRGEIERLRESLEGKLRSLRLTNPPEVLPLHGQLSLEEQRRAILPRQNGRKIILATNVAESSLTVQGVSTVVDSGLARLSQLHPKTGFASLDLVRISRASATQRAGRAARTQPGRVYRAWSTHDELSMKPFEAPEIMRSELAETVLLLSSLGITQPDSLSWFESPPPGALKKASDFLKFIDALDADGRLTDLGQKMRGFPLHPRLAKLLILSHEKGFAETGAELAALLSDRLPSPTSRVGQENDLLDTWEAWHRDPSRFRSLEKTKRQLLQSLSSPSKKRPSSLTDWCAELLLHVYPDRLCRRRRTQDEVAKMVGGRGVRLHPKSTVQKSEYFIALDLVEGGGSADTTVHVAVGIPTERVEQQIKPKARLESHVEWNDDSQRFEFVQSYTWQNLTIGGENRRPAKPDEIQDQLSRLIEKRWDDLLKKNEALAAWVKRLEFLLRLQPVLTASNPSPVPGLDAEKFREALDQLAYGEASFTNVTEKDLVPYFENLMPTEVLKKLEKDCPATWIVPSGSRMKIQYSEEQGPFCEVRLQELFGLAETPLVAGQKLTLFLLGPNYRPVQVTRDLSSFWKNGYLEVRKEMKTRYPKHSWPENPLEAPAVAKGRSVKS